jgi:hypothetical protein
MTITKAQLTVLRKEMQAALNKAGIADFDLEVGNMRFGADEVTIKVQGKLKGVTTKTDRVFEQKVRQLGLKMVGEKGKQLTGYAPSRYKYPFSYTTVRGARYKCSEADAVRMFGK